MGAKRWSKISLAANQARSAIYRVNSHRNERSLADYEVGDENEQRLISSIISSEGQASATNAVPSECWPFLRSGKQAVDEWKAVDDNHYFYGCQVTINYQLSQKFADPRCNVSQAQSVVGDCWSLIDKPVKKEKKLSVFRTEIHRRVQLHHCCVWMGMMFVQSHDNNNNFFAPWIKFSLQYKGK